MSSNQDKIISLYNSGEEDKRATESRATGLEFYYTKKLLNEYINSKSNVVEIGCATGYYGMFYADKCARYTGVDIAQGNIDAFNQKIIKAGIKNINTMVGDATNLHQIPNNSFDVVLCLGPMYHLPYDERLKVLDECCRIAKDGAILAFAYINRLGVYAGACVNDNWRDIYPNAKTNKYVFELSTDDERPGIFYFTSPEEMEADAKQKKLEILKNCGLDFFFALCAINQMSEEQFSCYMEIADKMSESPSCTGLSNHALLICRK